MRCLAAVLAIDITQMVRANASVHHTTMAAVLCGFKLAPVRKDSLCIKGSLGGREIIASPTPVLRQQPCLHIVTGRIGCNRHLPYTNLFYFCQRFLNATAHEIHQHRKLLLVGFRHTRPTHIHVAVSIGLSRSRQWGFLPVLGIFQCKSDTLLQGSGDSNFAL